jgi:NADPH:quinone reductase-like Zn-dependent oxidoreductase
MNPITVCSPHNFELVKSYGAARVFDYKSPTVIEDIRRETRKSLKYALDCISEPESMTFCYEVLGRTRGRYCALEPYPDFLHTRPKTITPEWVLGPSALGQEIRWAPPFTREINPELRSFGVDWYITVQRLLDEGKLRPHPIKVISGGFDGVKDGLQMLRNKEVSGQKLVCSLA